MTVKKIEHQIRHHFYSHHETIFIDLKLRRMRFGRDAFALVAGAQAQEKARNDLLIKRKILGAHSFWGFEHVGFAYGPADRRQGFFDQLRVVIDDHRAAAVFQVEFGAVGGGDARERFAHELLDALAHLFVQRAHGAFHFYFGGDDVWHRAHGAFHFYFGGDDVWPVAAVNRADGDDDRLERINASAFDRLQGGDALGSHYHCINAFVRGSGVDHLAVDGNGKTVR